MKQGTPMRIRAYRDSDWAEWLRMAMTLFADASFDEHETDMRAFRARADAEVFVVERPDGALAGYVEVGSRAYAEGCATSPVGYIEEWYVDSDVRRAGHGRALLQAAEDWARGRGYQEIASDALLENEISHRAHQRSGYELVERIVVFRKSLDR
jgi:aminoglycoside 6'-N-acetyltransferase I